MPFMLPPWNERMVGVLPHGSSEAPGGGPAGSGANLSGKIWYTMASFHQSSGLPGSVGDGVTTTRPVADWPGLTRSFQSPQVPWLGGVCWVSAAKTRTAGNRPRFFEAFADDEPFRRILLAVPLATRSPDAVAGRRERSALRSRALVSADVAFMVSSASREYQDRPRVLDARARCSAAFMYPQGSRWAQPMLCSPAKYPSRIE